MDFSTLLNIKEDLWTYLSATDKKIVMYGTGNGADKIIDVLVKKQIRLYGIFASDGFVRDRMFRGYKVKSYSDFCAEDNDFIVIVSFASQRDDVLDNIYRIASERELYAPDVPVYGDGLFDLEYFKNNIHNFESTYNMLSDELSRKTFICTIAYKLTGKIEYLKECETSSDEVFFLLKSKISNLNYLDIGAYNGDTLIEYTDRFGKDMSLYAFEPNKKNYAKLLTNLEQKSLSCICHNHAAWDKNETLRFYSNSGRSGTLDSTIENRKFTEVSAISVDELINESIGFVKIDAEGSDVKALHGMKKLISDNLPCIKIAAYHRNDDYFVIPQEIKNIHGSFGLYMRHLKYVPAWDTDFIFEFIKD